jgi:O-antigen ligase/tetratricopeptide (TPR) repeat protein
MSVPKPVAVGLLERLATAGLVVATTLSATFAVLIAGSFGPFELRLVYDGIAAAVLVPWLVVAALNRSWLPSSRLMPAIGACLTAFAVSTITSRAPRLSLEMFGYAVLLAELYLLLVVLMRRPRLRAHFARLALVLCVIVCVLYLLQVFLAWREWWGLIGRLAVPPLRPAYLGLTLGSPNPLAALVLVLMGFVLATIDVRGRAARVAAALLGLLVAAVVLLTASRGAWLATAAAVVVTVGAAITAIRGASSRAADLVRSRAGVTGGVVFALLLVGAGGLAAQSGRLTLDDAGRDAFAAASLRMFQSSPLTGMGPGTWQVLRESNTVPGQYDAYVPHAHSVYWQALAEFGLLGVVAGVVVAISLGLLILRALRSDDQPRRRVALAALFVVVLLAAHQVVDMFMNVPPLLLAIALPLAWLDAVAPDDGTARRWVAWTRLAVPVMVRQRVFPLALVVITCAIVAGLFRMESVTGVEVRAVSAADTGNWADAAGLARQAADADPDLAGYQFTLGVAAANAGDLARAETALTRSATADDYTYAWLDLAAVRWRLGDVNGARLALSRAERLGFQRPKVALPAGWLRQQLGDRQAALTDYVDALTGAPTLSSDPFWSSTAAVREIWPSVWAAAQTALEGRTLVVLDLVAGRLDLAKPVAATLAQGDPALYSLVVPAWEGDAGSWAALEALAAAHPLDADAIGWCELVAGNRHDQAAISRYGLWTEINGSSANLPPFARVTTAMTQTVPPSVFDDYALLYRRPVPADQIVNTLPRLAWQDHP